MHISVRRALQTAVIASGVVVSGSGLALASPDSAAPSPVIRCDERTTVCTPQEQAAWNEHWMAHIPVSTTASTPDCPCEEGTETECEKPPTTTVPTLPSTTLPSTTVPPITFTPGTSTPGTTPVTTTTAATSTPHTSTSKPHTTSTSARPVVQVGGSHRVPPAQAQRTPELANTGVSPVMLLLGGLATVLAGVAAVLFGRRKRA